MTRSLRTPALCEPAKGWKYVFYADRSPSQLFDLENDPRELDDLGGHPGYLDTRARLHAALCEILDPEKVNDAAFASQAQLVEQLGGVAKVLRMAGFNHTPLEA